MDKLEAEFYTEDNGEKPAKDFILGLDIKMRAKVLGIINVLEAFYIFSTMVRR